MTIIGTVNFSIHNNWIFNPFLCNNFVCIWYCMIFWHSFLLIFFMYMASLLLDFKTTNFVLLKQMLLFLLFGFNDRGWFLLSNPYFTMLCKGEHFGRESHCKYTIYILCKSLPHCKSVTNRIQTGLSRIQSCLQDSESCKQDSESCRQDCIRDGFTVSIRGRST